MLFITERVVLVTPIRVTYNTENRKIKQPKLDFCLPYK